MNSKTRIVSLLSLVSMLGIFLASGCEEHVTAPGHTASGAKVVLRMNQERPAASPNRSVITLQSPAKVDKGSLFRIGHAAAGNLTPLMKPGAIEAIDQAEVAFYDVDMPSMEDLFQRLQDSTIYFQLLELEEQSHPMTFEEWLSYGEDFLDILSTGNPGLEKRGSLDISGNTARGEFLLTEGVKAALVGLFEGNVFLYLGQSDYFEAFPEDTTYVDIFLAYAGPMRLSISSPLDNASTVERVMPIEGAVLFNETYGSEPLIGTLTVNSAVTQQFAINFDGSFLTTALLTERTNRVEISVTDTIANASVGRTFTVNFTGNFPLLRAALSWNGIADLDLHMLNPNGLECYFGNSQIGGMALDVDNTFGYGPENISVTTDTIPGSYEVSVVNFSSTLGVTANVKIFKYNAGLDAEELIDEQNHLFSTTDPWQVGSYILP